MYFIFSICESSAILIQINVTKVKKKPFICTVYYSVCFHQVGLFRKYTFFEVFVKSGCEIFGNLGNSRFPFVYFISIMFRLLTSLFVGHDFCFFVYMRKPPFPHKSKILFVSFFFFSFTTMPKIKTVLMKTTFFFKKKGKKQHYVS